MRLINTSNFDFEEFFGDKVPKYTILSHTWGEDELSFHDWRDSSLRAQRVKTKGYVKIQEACRVAAKSTNYLWIDTVCINKESSAELSEAINSMFAWYQNSAVCIAWLDDFVCDFTDPKSWGRLQGVRWFTRGWTLQELLAPREVEFFDASWQHFGTKTTLAIHLSVVTGIHVDYLSEPESIFRAPVARRMSWVATRTTSRAEDIAYCMLGIFEINMPLLYGEGSRAFIRLQEEIIARTNDHTIFCWSWPTAADLDSHPSWYGCLAPRPITFRDSGRFEEDQSHTLAPSPANVSSSDHQLTNNGLRINLRVMECLLLDFKLVIFDVKDPATGSQVPSLLAVCVQVSKGPQHLARSRFPNRLLRIPLWWMDNQARRTVYLHHERDPDKIEASKGNVIQRLPDKPVSEDDPSYGLLPVYSPSYAHFLWGDEGKPSVWPLSEAQAPCGTYGAAYILAVSQKSSAFGPGIVGLAARDKSFALGHHIVQNQWTGSVSDRWNVKTIIKFKPRRLADSVERQWKICDLWELKLSMLIDSQFEFEVEGRKQDGTPSTIKIRPIMLNPSNSYLYLDNEYHQGRETYMYPFEAAQITAPPSLFATEVEQTPFNVQALTDNLMARTRWNKLVWGRTDAHLVLLDLEPREIDEATSSQQAAATKEMLN